MSEASLDIPSQTSDFEFKLVKAADHLNAKLAEQAESSGSEAEHAE